MKKKVGLLIKDLYSGGAERAICRLSYILDDEYEIYMILFNGDNIDYDFKGKLINLDIKLKKGLFGKIIVTFKRILKVRKVKKQLGLNTTISYLENANLINILSMTNDKKIVSVRNYKTAEKNDGIINNIKSILMRLLYKYADYVVPVSEVIKNELIKSYNINENKIKVIYNAYDIDEIKKSSLEKLEEKYKKLFDKRDVICTVGRIVYQKGFWNLIKVIKILKDDLPNILLIIIGDELDRNISENIKKMIRENDLEENVVLMGVQKNPFKYISKAKCYVMSSLFEGFPNALVEAMACEVPVVSVDCKSGPREILFENFHVENNIKNMVMADYGIIVPEFDKNLDFNINNIQYQHVEMAEAIKKIINNNTLNIKYKKYGKKRAEVFNYKVCKKKYSELI